MWATRKLRSWCARKHLGLESLEARQLMAADLSLPLLSLSNPTVLVGARTFDGSGNNLVSTEWGSTNEQLLRMADADYGDSVSSLAGGDRPNARVISNALAAQDENAELNDRKLSAFVYVFGQFLDHDIDLTEAAVSAIEGAAIAVPSGDAYFDPAGTGTQTIAFTRSRYDSSTGTDSTNPRQQINEITAWIDGSMIYGSDKAAADSLRTFSRGQLKTSADNLLPVDANGNFVAGDSRANENIELSSMQALFVREHNRIAAKLARDNPTWTDEQIYQQARAMVGAELQVITYKEFLPALLGNNALSRYRGYNANVDPSIANEFSTAAFRLHTLINDDVEFFGNDGLAVRDEVELREAFFNPNLLQATGIDNILKYAASTLAQESDNQIVDGLRNFLFGDPGHGGLDLAALNIQRGRDHGLADYNSVREAYGLARVTSFAQISSDPDVQHTLESLYRSVDNIDLWVGILAEDHAPGASVGELARTIISDQFERLRDGDRYWYQRVFSGRTLAELEQTTLSSIIKRNTTINNLQSNVFVMSAEVTGRVFMDDNTNGRKDRFEMGIPGVEVQLLNNEGTLLATTRTGRDGVYRFTSFSETGMYTVRVVPPSRLAGANLDRAVQISRGGLTINNVSFGLRRQPINATAVASTTASTTNAALAVDTVFTDLQFQNNRTTSRQQSLFLVKNQNRTPNRFGRP